MATLTQGAVATAFRTGVCKPGMIVQVTGLAPVVSQDGSQPKRVK